MEKPYVAPIPTADKAAAHNSTEKDEYGKGAVDGAPCYKQESPKESSTRIKV